MIVEAGARDRLIDSADRSLVELVVYPAQSQDHIGGRRFPEYPVDVLGMCFGNLDGRWLVQSS